MVESVDTMKSLGGLPARDLIEKIDHLGIAVPSLADAIPVYETLLGQSVEHIEVVEDQRVRTAFFTVGESHFELLSRSMARVRSVSISRSVGAGFIMSACASKTLRRCWRAIKRQVYRLIDESPRQGANNDGGSRASCSNRRCLARGGSMLERVVLTAMVASLWRFE